MLCASLGGRWVWGRMDTCICMAESLHYLPETTTTLLISYSVSHSVLSNSATPWTIAHEAPLSVEFSRQEYWCGSPFPSPGDLPNSEIKPQYKIKSLKFFFLNNNKKHRKKLNSQKYKIKNKKSPTISIHCSIPVSGLHVAYGW